MRWFSVKKCTPLIRDGTQYRSMMHIQDMIAHRSFGNIKVAMGDELIEVELNTRMKWAGDYFRYTL